jgi:hypothetical protein
MEEEEEKEEGEKKKKCQRLQWTGHVNTTEDSINIINKFVAYSPPKEPHRSTRLLKLIGR